jgi:hypothetical protein
MEEKMGRRRDVDTSHYSEYLRLSVGDALPVVIVMLILIDDERKIRVRKVLS